MTFYFFASLSQPGKDVVSFDISNISESTGLEVSSLIGANTLAQPTMHIDYRHALVKFDYTLNRGYRPAGSQIGRTNVVFYSSIAGL